ncbi:MAG: squalene/phytoene synthase family protein, partial [Opitutales bacterium]|nr:squalene/phytoene synthase family protein [Opitutales bacterium]
MPLSLESAYAKCERLANSHYENFPVAKMVPKRLRKHVAAVYAFARTADDIADEEHESIAEDDPSRIERLAEFEAQLDVSDPSGLDPRWNWIFAACSDTVKKFSIPKSLFRDLVSAFAQDVVKKRYADFPELLDYCRRSANPVGRLVLLLHGFSDEERFAMSDDICTALQLANFWQDMRVDKLKNRIYIP